MNTPVFPLKKMNIDTEIFDLRGLAWDSPEGLRRIEGAAALLAQGKTVAFPTETVYGLGADALDAHAVEKIFLAKGRPSDNPLIVHIGKLEMLDNLVREIPEIARMLMDAFWPGPLSIIFKRSQAVPDRVTAGLETVAVRMPATPETRELILRSGRPIAAPSANLSGKPSPTKAEHILQDLAGRADGLILGRNCDGGLESTVIDVTVDPPAILRPGLVTREEIEGVIGPLHPIIKMSSVSDRRNLAESKQGSHSPCPDTIVPKAPGMKYTHYAPDAPMLLYRGAPETQRAAILKRAMAELQGGKRVGIIASDETWNGYSTLKEMKNADQLILFNTGSRKNLKTAAERFFAFLREFDLKKMDIILSESFSTDGIGAALMNRMEKAANEIIESE